MFTWEFIGTLTDPAGYNTLAVGDPYRMTVVMDDEETPSAIGSDSDFYFRAESITVLVGTFNLFSTNAYVYHSYEDDLGLYRVGFTTGTDLIELNTTVFGTQQFLQPTTLGTLMIPDLSGPSDEQIFSVGGSNGKIKGTVSGVSSTLAVPEPSTAALAAGVGVLALRRRRQGA